MTTFPSKLIKGELYAVKSSGFRFRPCYRLGYITSTPLPWSTITLFTSYPPILSVITKASSYGCMVPTLSSSEKLNAGRASTLALFGTRINVLGEWPSHRHHPGRLRTGSSRSNKDDVNGAQRGPCRGIPLSLWPWLVSLLVGPIQKLLQPPLSD